jgi:hypothetical protein
MMLHDLTKLFGTLPPAANQADYQAAVVNDNCLGKPTRNSRKLALRHLATLYGLTLANPLFRALRRLWFSDKAAQPLLALVVALARDPLLRSSQAFILDRALGTPISRYEVADYLARLKPDPFSAASLKSLAQNVAGTWTAAGFLSGHVRKTRSNPVVRPENVALCLFLGYLEGRTGQRLFTSDWINLLACSPGELETLANSASHRGLLVFMNAGGVKEIRFPGYLTPEEERIRQEVSHVI